MSDEPLIDAVGRRDIYINIRKASFEAMGCRLGHHASFPIIPSYLVACRMLFKSKIQRRAHLRARSAEEGESWARRRWWIDGAEMHLCPLL